jgi:polysaccharide biosynthesis protein PslG
MIDGVSIHPYVDPEVVGDSYAKVRALIEPYNGEGRDIAILSTEWGFATNKFVSDDLQADVLVRMFLMNRSFRIPISIAYVAVDRTEAYVPEEERTYGIVRADYSPKAAFILLKDMTARLDGLQFRERLASDPADFILAFGDGSRTLIAAWTSGEPRDAVINGTPVPLTSRPIYLDG